MAAPHPPHNGHEPLAQLQYEVNLFKGVMLERLERLERLVLEQMGKQDGVEVEIAEITNDLEGMVATKADVADLKEGMAATKADVADLKKDVAEFKEATKADVADLKKKFNWGIGVFIISQALIWFQLSKLSKLSK
jgi:Fic family protein